MSRPRHVWFALSFALAACAADQPPTPGSSSRPVTAQRLRESRLEHIQSDPSMVWTFSEKTFVLVLGGRTVPTKLVETLMGSADRVARVEGAWRLDEDKGELVLSDVTGDGKPGRKSARLRTSPAGLIRIDLGDDQYNIVPAESPVKGGR
jgi:hypothetical protein